MTTGAMVARPGEVQAAAAQGTTTRALRAGGAAAGPVFLTVAAAQALTRDGYDLSWQPLRNGRRRRHVSGVIACASCA